MSVCAEEVSAEEKLFFSKRPRAIDFQPYAGQLPKAVGQLGTLGADLDRPELVEKRMQRLKIKEFARGVREAQEKMRPVEATPESRAESKQDKARQYATQNVPKPRARAKVAQATADADADADDDHDERSERAAPDTRVEVARMAPASPRRSRAPAAVRFDEGRGEIREARPAQADSSMSAAPTALRARPIAAAKFESVVEVPSPAVARKPHAHMGPSGALDSARFFEPSQEWALGEVQVSVKEVLPAGPTQRKPVGKKSAVVQLTQPAVRVGSGHASVSAPSAEVAAPAVAAVGDEPRRKSAMSQPSHTSHAPPAPSTPKGKAAAVTSGGGPSPAAPSRVRPKPQAAPDASGDPGLQSLVANHEAKRDMVADFRRQFGF